MIRSGNGMQMGPGKGSGPGAGQGRNKDGSYGTGGYCILNKVWRKNLTQERSKMYYSKMSPMWTYHDQGRDGPG